jgi:MerR family transcriptional regulator, thiopeptide resistance regulator
MLLKVGELAKRAGLTVRALHHYDSIGLLSPSARSDAGYRLYNRDDVARLHQIQALQQFGMALADIGVFLAGPGSSLPAIIEQQVAVLAQKIAQAGRLHAQLTLLQHQLQAGEEPDLAGWLSTLELMTMYDKYFSKDELATLPFFSGQQKCVDEWDAMVAEVRALVDAGTPADAPQAGALALRWMTMLERDTGGHAGLAAKLVAMQAAEPALRQMNGITPQTEAYVREALACVRLSLFAKYLAPTEFAFLSAHYRERQDEWPGLIAKLRAALDAGLAPHDAQVRPLALHWATLWRSFAGDDPAVHAKIRTAYEKEPKLMVGSFITEELQAFVGQALASLSTQE